MVADNQERGAFEAERAALRSALRFPDSPSRAEHRNPGAQPSAAQIQLPHRAGERPTALEGDPLTVIIAAVDHMASSLDALVERVDRLTDRLDALEATLSSSGQRFDAWPVTGLEKAGQ